MVPGRQEYPVQGVKAGRRCPSGRQNRVGPVSCARDDHRTRDQRELGKGSPSPPCNSVRSQLCVSAVRRPRGKAAPREPREESNFQGIDRGKQG